jgi:hypothetical protein
MGNLDPSRRHRQLLLFDPEPVLPLWKDLPEDTRARVRTLLVKMLQEHVARLVAAEENEGEAHER